MNVAASPAVTGQQPSPKEREKLVRAAEEFEAILLEMFLRPLAESFSSLPGTEPEMGMSGYRELGLQGLAAGMAKGGGIGLADMIVRKLLHTQDSEMKVRPLVQGVPMGLKLFFDPPIVTVSAAHDPDCEWESDQAMINGF